MTANHFFNRRTTHIDPLIGERQQHAVGTEHRKHAFHRLATNIRVGRDVDGITPDSIARRIRRQLQQQLLLLPALGRLAHQAEQREAVLYGEQVLAIRGKEQAAEHKPALLHMEALPCLQHEAQKVPRLRPIIRLGIEPLAFCVPKRAAIRLINRIAQLLPEFSLSDLSDYFGEHLKIRCWHRWCSNLGTAALHLDL